MNNPFCCLFFFLRKIIHVLLAWNWGKRWAERAFSNLFKFYNQIAIIWQSHKLSTFSSHPPWGPNILNSRMKKGTETFTTNPLKAANPRKEGRETSWDREPGRTEENRDGVLVTMGGSPSVHFWFLSPGLDQVFSPLADITSLRQVLQNCCLGPIS